VDGAHDVDDRRGVVQRRESDKDVGLTDRNQLAE
jgi:hypothetical protein